MGLVDERGGAEFWGRLWRVLGLMGLLVVMLASLVDERRWGWVDGLW